MYHPDLPQHNLENRCFIHIRYCELDSSRRLWDPLLPKSFFCAKASSLVDPLKRGDGTDALEKIGKKIEQVRVCMHVAARRLHDVFFCGNLTQFSLNMFCLCRSPVDQIFGNNGLNLPLGNKGKRSALALVV